MRLIGHLNNEANARTFGDYLTLLKVVNEVEPDSDGTWAVWVHSEDQLEAANVALTDYLRDPNAPKYRRASAEAAKAKEAELKAKSEFAKRVITSDSLWPRSALGPLTMVLIGICVAVALLMGMPPSSPVLYMSVVDSRSLPEIRSGEVWRLLTPIFIHYSIFHILFNMLWLKDLGSMIESRQGSIKLALLVVVVGVGSNLGQDLVAGPGFGGMSGVLYGLFGYIWMRGKLDPASGLRLAPADVVMMIGWFFLCLFHIIGNVANGAHGFGLVIGMVWGAGPPLVKKLLKV